MKILQIMNFYSWYLNDLYKRRPELLQASALVNTEAHIEEGFAGSHVLVPGFRELGVESALLVSNDPVLQEKYVHEYGVPSGPEGLKEQIRLLQPDILYTNDPMTFDAAWLKSLPYRPPVCIAWRAATIPAGCDMSGWDCLIGSDDSILRIARQHGAKRTEKFFPGFPEHIAKAVANETKQYDVVASGQWSAEHTRRSKTFLEIAKAPLGLRGEFSIAFFLASPNPYELPAGVSMYNRGPVWGIEMYRALARGRILVNGAIDIAQVPIGNMRTYEGTGVGVFQITNYSPELQTIFEPGKEIETYDTDSELLDKIYYYLKNPGAAAEIAQRGQERCLRDHGVRVRAKQFIELSKLISQ